jgi:hypothetical protein
MKELGQMLRAPAHCTAGWAVWVDRRIRSTYSGSIDYSTPGFRERREGVEFCLYLITHDAMKTWLDISDQFHFPAALSPKKEPPVAIIYIKK